MNTNEKDDDEVGVDVLKGKIVKEIKVDKNGNSDSIQFYFEDKVLTMYHDQNCCENVLIEDIIGDMKDLVGSEILVSEERSNQMSNLTHDSCTYTFYTIRTMKGSVDIRWLGESNGYYSESVDFILETV